MFNYNNKYEPLNKYEFTRELNVRVFFLSIILGLFWVLLTVLGFLFTRTSTPVLYWIWRIASFTTKWGCIVLFAVFIIREIWTLIFFWRHRNG